MTPRVTVLMPVYNAGRLVADAVNSILRGHFRDLELLAINDGSTDESDAILRSIDDPRLRIVNNPENLGVVATLNRGLEMAEGALIARMDADDISLPDRLDRQVAFMDANTDVGICGMWAMAFGAGTQERKVRAPSSASEIHVQLFGYNALCHPTVMFRQEALVRHSLRFSSEARHAEDLDLWMRAAEHFPLANIPRVGLRYRVHADQVTRRYAAEQHQTLSRLRRRQLSLLLPGSSEQDVQLHLNILDVGKALTREELLAAEDWLDRLERANERCDRYDKSLFQSFLIQRWLNACHRCVPSDLATWRIWRNSRFASIGAATNFWLFVKKAFGR